MNGKGGIGQGRSQKEKAELPRRRSVRGVNQTRGTSTGKASMIGISDQTALHTPAWINEVKLTRFLINTGSEVNLISVRDTIKHGFSYEMAGIQKIRGFNGSSSFLDGTIECEIRVGRCCEPHRVKFFVKPVVTIPIIGYPTLPIYRSRLTAKNGFCKMIGRTSWGVPPWITLKTDQTGGPV